MGKVKLLTKEEKRLYRNQIYDLWKICFGDSYEYMNYYFSWKYEINKVFVDIEDDEVVAMLHLNPYEVMWNKEQLSLFYIVGVATLPAFRKQGRMAKLLENTFEYLYGLKHPFVYLMPAKEEIYYPFDFRYISKEVKEISAIENKLDVDIVEKSLSNLLDRGQVDGLENVCKLSNDVLNEIFTLYTKRSKDYYVELACEMESAGGDVLLFYKEQELVGVAAYMLEDNNAEIVECLSLKGYGSKVRTSLEKYIKMKQDLTKSFSIKYIDSLYGNENTRKYIMARIIDLDQMVKYFPVDAYQNKRIRVIDNYIQQNNQLITPITRSDIVSAADLHSAEEITLNVNKLISIIFEEQTICINEIV